MKNVNIKLFTMFLAGILFSAITVFAATVNVSTNFSSNAIQYLQKLVLIDSNWTTWITLDGAEQKINTNTICDTDGNNCRIIDDILTGSALDWYLTGSDLDWYLTGSALDWYLTGSSILWSKNSNNIYYMGTVGIGVNTPSTDTKLHVAWKLKVDGSIQIWTAASDWCTSASDGGKIMYKLNCTQVWSNASYQPNIKLCTKTQNGMTWLSLINVDGWSELDATCPDWWDGETTNPWTET